MVRPNGGVYVRRLPRAELHTLLSSGVKRRILILPTEGSIGKWKILRLTAQDDNPQPGRLRSLPSSLALLRAGAALGMTKGLGMTVIA